MTQNIAEAIIRDENDDLRFENFCRELCQRADGIALLPTSQSYDQARDAKAFDPELHYYVGATHDKKIETKVDKDSKHLSATSAPHRIRYCIGFPLSEKAIDDFEKVIKANIPTATSVRVLSSLQIAALAVQHDDLLWRYYATELRAIEATFKADGTQRPDEDALRLALLTMGTDDARQLRKEIGQHAILQVLARASKELTIQQVAATIASDLRFPTSIHPDLIANLLVDLEQRGLTTTNNDGWRLTESGQEAAKTVPTETALHILEGARVVQSALQTLTGYNFTDLQFTQLWSIFLDFLAELFHSKGLVRLAREAVKQRDNRRKIPACDS